MVATAQENKKKLPNITDKYTPTEKEEYMCNKHLAYFQKRLLEWREELSRESDQTLENLPKENWHEPDLNDRASLESDTGIELRTRDRYRKLINKIDKALDRIENDEYGYCVETGEEIGLKRLIARPIAHMTIEAQERHERRESQRRDFNDDYREED